MKLFLMIITILVLCIIGTSPIMASPVLFNSHIYIADSCNQGSAAGGELGLGMGFGSGEISVGVEVFTVSDLEYVDLNMNIYAKLPANLILGTNIDMTEKNDHLPALQIGLYKPISLNDQFNLYIGAGISAIMTNDSGKLDKDNGYFGEVQIKYNFGRQGFIYSGCSFDTMDNNTVLEAGIGFAFK